MTQQDNGIPGPLDVRRAVALPAADTAGAWAALVPGGAAAPVATAVTAVTAAGAEPSAAAGGGRRRKVLLVAAVIAGVALLATPLLFIGGGDGEETRASGADSGPSAEAAPSEDRQPDAQDGESAPPSPTETAEPSEEPQEPSAPPQPETSSEPPAEPEADAPAEDSGQDEWEGWPPGDGWDRPDDQSPDGGDLSDSSNVVMYHVSTGRCAKAGGFGNGGGGATLGECGDSSSFGGLLWNLTVRQRDSGPGGAELFTLAGSGGGSCLEPSGGQVGAGPCQGGASDSQLWWLDEQGDGGHWIRNRGNGDMCLGGSDSRLTIAPCGSGGDLWALAGTGGGRR
ncbi:RICIN domain-containing protein [Streptomyces sp. SBT349]|uniref:RICIN domain-containing protein n=1 Tax=Streptomyces sp. SBT349 TaxID=1580539 RepID=UPI00066DA343|nr:hypothetical protein [Streptomyces sp. SBT349]